MSPEAQTQPVSASNTSEPSLSASYVQGPDTFSANLGSNLVQQEWCRNRGKSGNQDRWTNGNQLPRAGVRSIRSGAPSILHSQTEAGVMTFVDVGNASDCASGVACAPFQSERGFLLLRASPVYGSRFENHLSLYGSAQR